MYYTKLVITVCSYESRALCTSIRKACVLNNRQDRTTKQ